jgi:hypothetical protein
VPVKLEGSTQFAAAARVATSWPRMRYGELEDLLVEMTGGERTSVLARFRNLRQMPFPDAIRIGTGNRVEYDLPRILALCAAFELSALFIPQSSAVAIVRAVWPELVRGFVAAAVEAGLATRPKDMPSNLSSTVAVLIDGFAPAGTPGATASNLVLEPQGDVANAQVAGVRIECGILIALLARRLGQAVDYAEGARTAFHDLDRAFGWTPGSIPHRAAATDMDSGTSFLDIGPYIGRADAFLRIAATLKAPGDDGPADRARSRQAAQQLLDYFGNPSPIDVWKAELGTIEGAPRLKHLLAAVGKDVGLSHVPYPDTILSSGRGSAAKQARALVEKASRLESERRRTAVGEAH